MAILLLLTSNNSISYLGDGSVTAPVHTFELFIIDIIVFICFSSVIVWWPLTFILFVFDIVSFIIFCPTPFSKLTVTSSTGSLYNNSGASISYLDMVQGDSAIFEFDGETWNIFHYQT